MILRNDFSIWLARLSTASSRRSGLLPTGYLNERFSRFRKRYRNKYTTALSKHTVKVPPLMMILPMQPSHMLKRSRACEYFSTGEETNSRSHGVVFETADAERQAFSMSEVRIRTAQDTRRYNHGRDGFRGCVFLAGAGVCFFSIFQASSWTTNGSRNLVPAVPGPHRGPYRTVQRRVSGIFGRCHRLTYGSVQLLTSCSLAQRQGVIYV
jgi:hypothetical protein